MVSQNSLIREINGPHEWIDLRSVRNDKIKMKIKKRPDELKDCLIKRYSGKLNFLIHLKKKFSVIIV